MASFRPAGQLKQLQTLVLKRFQLFNQGSPRIEPRYTFLPVTWNFAKTFVTSKVYFKSDSDKSKSLVNHRCPYCEMDLSCKSSLDQHIAKCLEYRNFKDSKIEAFVQKEIMKRKRLFYLARVFELDKSVDPIKVPNKVPHKIPKKIPRRSQKRLPRRLHRKSPKMSPKRSPRRSPRRFPNRKISAISLKPKPSECDVCGECFAQQAHLDTHKASQHTEDLKLVECSVCSETFKNLRQLQTHVLKFH